jgi:hypothetical protein
MRREVMSHGLEESKYVTLIPGIFVKACPYVARTPHRDLDSDPGSAGILPTSFRFAGWKPALPGEATVSMRRGDLLG